MCAAMLRSLLARDAMETILVVNAGSSSLKFEVFAIGRGLRKLLRGQTKSVGTTPRLRVEDAMAKC
jgi:acetate kinase